MPLVSVPDASWVAEVGEVAGVELVPWDLHEAHERARELVIVVPPYLDPRQRLDLLVGLPELRVVQLLTAGYEQALPQVPAGVQLCNAGGVHDASTSELTLALILASLRGIPEFVAAQQDSRWLPTRLWEALADRRVMVVGYGQVGRAVVRRLLPFEVQVTAVASRARAGDDLVDEVHGIEELAALLPVQDVVVLIVPLSDSTTGLVDAQFLAAMKDGALVVNVARGKVVDTQALLAETSSGRLRAALDVTDPEPLPADHSLWTSPGVLISPHVGGASTAFRPRAVKLVRAQLQAYAWGSALANVVATG
ncbi:2-hydroxyacid dehydrogenase [Lapillicoccus sp.]|uniref:2-hydroxyacid dehydrogenase n=1 Tax=Lapillicoccus sp. TaxID=1909287 RepID=UPI003262D0CC